MLVGQAIGPFTIEKELGSGAMGTVYRAVHLQLKLRVALKVMAPGLTNEVALKRFKREADILKQLKHPNIVRLVGIGKHHKSPFYAMEYVEGESLDHVMDRRGRISWEEVVELGKQLCAGLQHAHEHSIIHRDLKPSNVMVLAPGKDQMYGTVKLTDFGIAKNLDASEQYTATNCTVGTASYMSPEQCRGERDLTSKSDLYSLGVMLYELVTGKKPFVAESIMEMFQLHEKGIPVRPARLVPEVPIWLDTLIMQLLEKKPDQRSLNAAAVGEALERIKEKVEAQQSAGVEAATRRRIDRSTLHPELDETDKEVARTLVNKKKKRRKKVPFFRQGWFQGVALTAVLAGIGYFVYWAFIKAPSPEVLLAEARLLMKADGSETQRKARKGPIAEFLRLYPQHPEAKQVQQWADQIDLDQLDTAMRNRRNGNWGIDVPAEEHFRQALDREDKGKLKDAEAAWQQVLEYKNPEDNDERTWHRLAEKYLPDLQAVDGTYKELKARVEKDLKREKDSKDKKDAQPPAAKEKTAKATPSDEQLALEAVRAELTAHPGEARERWDELKTRTGDEFTRRRWHLLAATRLRELAVK